MSETRMKIAGPRNVGPGAKTSLFAHALNSHFWYMVQFQKRSQSNGHTFRLSPVPIIAVLCSYGQPATASIPLTPVREPLQQVFLSKELAVQQLGIKFFDLDVVRQAPPVSIMPPSSTLRQQVSSCLLADVNTYDIIQSGLSSSKAVLTHPLSTRVSSQLLPYDSATSAVDTFSRSLMEAAPPSDRTQSSLVIKGSKNSYLYASAAAGISGSSAGQALSCLTAARIATDQGQYDGALLLYNYIATKFPDLALSAYARVGRALMLYQTGNTSDAILALEDEAVPLVGSAEIHAALAVLLYNERPSLAFRAEEEWEIANSFDSRYSDVEWVRTAKHWPEHMLEALQRFLLMNTKRST
ncbi:hypothetical protein CEUSTIGMA_g6122.t1 [Chlamydomonas eustigma]|uniref:Uncharacterized protein n=1 Tax=Chlamydomonas eustigma TaxID=1157962 RepID=A0A250X6G9_9CHLO|nr:hypothetical protein CEUSTIGMA_g6122.t1 [Chlamydomonas eustigma]|eukprot:GAX78684.1 hypothetical protein CEUSTIGMA_g6122.t1 [Chlamydomonas eustigma]